MPMTSSSDIQASSFSPRSSSFSPAQATALPPSRSIVHPLQNHNHNAAAPKAAPAKAVATSTVAYANAEASTSTMSAITSNTSAAATAVAAAAASSSSSMSSSMAGMHMTPASDQFRTTSLRQFDYAKMIDLTSGQPLLKKPDPADPLVQMHDPANPNVTYESCIAGTTHDFLDIPATVQVYPTFADFPVEQRPSKARYDLTRCSPASCNLKLRCPFCRGTYGGVNAKAIWERHVKDHWPKPGEIIGATPISHPYPVVRPARVPRLPRQSGGARSRRNKSRDFDEWDDGQSDEASESDVSVGSPAVEISAPSVSIRSAPRLQSTRAPRRPEISKEVTRGFSGAYIATGREVYFPHLPPQKDARNIYEVDEDYNLIPVGESPFKPRFNPIARPMKHARKFDAAGLNCHLSEAPSNEVTSRGGLLSSWQPTGEEPFVLLNRPVMTKEQALQACKQASTGFTDNTIISCESITLMEQDEDEDYSQTSPLKRLQYPDSFDTTMPRKRCRDEEDEEVFQEPLPYTDGSLHAYKRRRVLSVGSISSLASVPYTNSDDELSFETYLDADSPCVATPPADSPVVSFDAMDDAIAV